MSKMKKTNRYDNAYAEVSAFRFADEKQKKEILKMVRQEIEDKDAVANHVLLLSVQHDPVDRVYNTKLNYQMFGDKALNKISDNFKTLGYEKMIILHKAEKVSPKKVEKVQSESDKKIDELQKQVEMLLSKGSADIPQTVNSGPSNQMQETKQPVLEEKQNDSEKGSGQIEDQELFDGINGMRVADLKDYALQNSIKLADKATKDEIVKVIYDFQLSKNTNK